MRLSGISPDSDFVKKIDLPVLGGCLAIFGSAFFFYMATVVLKWSRLAGLDIDSAYFVFFRFFTGFLTVLFAILVFHQKVIVVKPSYLLGRTLANCVAVYCFFKGVGLTSVAQANILNMTYPLFIAVFSWIFLKGQRDTIALLIVLAAFTGVWLILSPSVTGFETDSLWALASGISAAVAIIYLNLSRRVHNTTTTLFFLFGLGSVIIFGLFFHRMYIPDAQTLKYLLLCSFFSILGQYLITLGFRYVTAIEGGIISSTRILLAAVLGPLIAMDPSLTLTGWIGALLIFGGNVYLTVRKAAI